MSKNGEDQPTVPGKRVRIQERPQLWLALLGFVLLAASLAIHWLLPLATAAGLASPTGFALLLVAAVEATLLWYFTWMLLAWLSTFTSHTSRLGFALRAAIDSAAPASARKLAARALVSTSLAGTAVVGLTGLATAEPIDPILFPASPEEISQEDVKEQQVWWPDGSAPAPPLLEEHLPEAPQPPATTEVEIPATPLSENPEPSLKAPVTATPKTTATPETTAKPQVTARTQSPVKAGGNTLTPLKPSGNTLGPSRVQEPMPPTTSPTPRHSSRQLSRSESSSKTQKRAQVAAPQERTHTVLPGDCLWSIAGSMLGPEASDREVAGLWPLIYDLNAVVIGGDPNLIEPGQVLLLPDLGRTADFSLEDGRAA